MDITLNPSVLCGEAEAPPSKSAAHRILICAALSGGRTVVRCPSVSEDIAATIACLKSLGCIITVANGSITVENGFCKNEEALLDCGESGSTLRFLLPVAAALGRSAAFTGRGKLASRPLQPLCDSLSAHGISISDSKLPLRISGSLSGGCYEIRADISSQFITGLLLALPLCGSDSEIILTGHTVSAPYIDITTDIQKKFGILHERTESGFRVKNAKYSKVSEISVEGDYSNAAFWLTAGAVGSGGIRCTNLLSDTRQGDKKIIDVLSDMGAKIKQTADSVFVGQSQLHATEIDCSDIPDLVPVLSVAACRASGTTVFQNTARLRQKESDRVESTVNMIRSLGGSIDAGENYIKVSGHGELHGGTVDACGDHRIAMSAAVASVFSKGCVTIIGAGAVNKSYPDFFKDFKALKGDVQK